jgi:hypothetical protein
VLAIITTLIQFASSLFSFFRLGLREGSKRDSSAA